jgi:hypothetical protein
MGQTMSVTTMTVWVAINLPFWWLGEDWAGRGAPRPVAIAVVVVGHASHRKVDNAKH